VFVNTLPYVAVVAVLLVEDLLGLNSSFGESTSLAFLHLMKFKLLHLLHTPGLLALHLLMGFHFLVVVGFFLADDLIYE